MEKKYPVNASAHRWKGAQKKSLWTLWRPNPRSYKVEPCETNAFHVASHNEMFWLLLTKRIHFAPRRFVWNKHLLKKVDFWVVFEKYRSFKFLFIKLAWISSIKKLFYARRPKLVHAYTRNWNWIQFAYISEWGIVRNRNQSEVLATERGSS